MRLKTKYILIVSIIHAIFIAITVIVFYQNKVMFILCEALLVLSIFLFIYFYKTIFRPFKLLNAGVESISDKDFSMKFLPVGQRELDKLIEVFNKMIEHLRLERTKTTEKNFFLEKLMEASPAGIVIMNKNNHIQTINPAAIRQLSLQSKDYIPENINTLPEPWNEELNKLNEFESIVMQLNGINQYKCYKSYFIDKGVKQPFYIIEELTKELLKAERQSYEKVIRMMSHEVNNSVGAVNSIIDSTVSYLNANKTDNINEYINVLRIAKERIVNLNHFTKRFADIIEIPPPNLTNCDLQEIIENVLIYFKIEFDQNKIKYKTDFQANNSNILFDYQQFELVLINIIKNAIQAIHNSGNISILFKDNPKILIIENNGEPIADNVQKKLFKPFFTNKKTGQGIGLTLIREILSNHLCDFSLQTRTDGITEFRIIFSN